MGQLEVVQAAWVLKEHRQVIVAALKDLVYGNFPGAGLTGACGTGIKDEGSGVQVSPAALYAQPQAFTLIRRGSNVYREAVDFQIH